jgi:asparagine synthase (glutamine-hydrolysing)
VCGICGIYHFGFSEQVQEQLLRQMTETLAHRGPDDEGYHCSGSIGLGFKRLSIIDLESGHQPMCDAERRVWVVFNGEIYNYRELRSELSSEGYLFRTTSDTEVLVHGYKHWGKEFLQRLNGMFALAVWDERERQLLIARDRMGIKPLYYSINGGTIVFGSEVRAILAVSGDAKPGVDLSGVYHFFRYRYTPAPLTVFKGIRKLVAGSRIIVSDGRSMVERWWGFAPRLMDVKFPRRELVERLEGIYKNAIQRHLISDVPIGLLLSGGVDSGLLLALMNLYGKEWKTYCVGYGTSDADDELSYAGETARLLGSSHYSVMLDKNQFENALSTTISSLEEPVTAPSIVPMYFVCRRARQDVKVALMGQGPDELFGGYQRHMGVHYGGFWRALPDVIRSRLKDVMRRVARSEAVKRSLYSIDEPDRLKRYQLVFSILEGKQIGDLFLDGSLEDGIEDQLLEMWSDYRPMISETDELGGFQFLEIRSSLPDELLMYADKLSMAHGLEIRVPYLDKEIVEFAETLPSRYKISGLQRKWIHKEVSRRYLPNSVVNRRKIGFAGNIIEQWFRVAMVGKMNGYFLDETSLMYRYLDRRAVADLYKLHRAGASNYSKILFNLIMFEEWLRHYLA